MNHFKTLEFDTILNRLADHAVSNTAKEKCMAITPTKNIDEAMRLANQTSEAKQIIEQAGSPPIAIMTDLEKIIVLLDADAMLTPDNIANVLVFLSSCTRLKAYLKRAESTQLDIAYYGNSMLDLSFLEEELSRCIHNEKVDDRATSKLYDLRRSIERKGEQIKTKIESLLKTNRQYCAESFVAVRNGRYTMPVKKEYKNKIPGILVEMSNTGGTCFIEPTAVSKLQDELSTLEIEEDNEVRTILYTLTALIFDNMAFIKVNMEAMETLDFIFAKAKLSISMKASKIRITQEREIRLLSAVHPLLDKQNQAPPIPLDFALGNGTKGLIITGPNTGGKTVAIKTVGLFSLMVQSGLHIPAHESSSICIFDSIWCDIGDGQSISQNLSTFSSHMTNIIDVLSKTTGESLILFDELGSGTDPAEGMGIATAILEELIIKNCLFVVTTHYPEIKEFAANTPGIVNARMAFDRESLLPLYRLEIGEAGESCAIHIAQRLGMPSHILERAKEITYSGAPQYKKSATSESSIMAVTPLMIREEESDEVKIPRSHTFNIGDSVMVYPQKELGIVYQRANSMGEIGVQIKKEKQLINHKRIKLHLPAEELYPDDYDFSILFDSVETRKARHLMGRKHVAGTRITHSESWEG